MESEATTLLALRTRAEDLRTKLQDIHILFERNKYLQWEEVLEQFAVLATQVNNLYKDLTPKLHHSVIQPLAINPLEPNQIPEFLRTKTIPEIETEEAMIIQTANSLATDFGGTDKLKELLIVRIEQYNSLCENLEETYDNLKDQMNLKTKHEPVLTETNQPALRAILTALATGSGLRSSVPPQPVHPPTHVQPSNLKVEEQRVPTATITPPTVKQTNPVLPPAIATAPLPSQPSQIAPKQFPFPGPQDVSKGPVKITIPPQIQSVHPSHPNQLTGLQINSRAQPINKLPQNIPIQQRQIATTSQFPNQQQNMPGHTQRPLGLQQSSMSGVQFLQQMPKQPQQFQQFQLQQQQQLQQMQQQQIQQQQLQQQQMLLQQMKQQQQNRMQ